MPWQETTKMELRLEFAKLADREGANMSQLCRRFEISRATGYKWLRRYREEGRAGLEDRSRRPHPSPNRTPTRVEDAVCAVRSELLTAVESRDDAYVRRRIDEEMTGTSATMVLLGEKTHERKWVAEEIEKTVDNGEGVVAMYLKEVKDSLPEDSCVAEALDEAGAEVLN